MPALGGPVTGDAGTRLDWTRAASEIPPLHVAQDVMTYSVLLCIIKDDSERSLQVVMPADLGLGGCWGDEGLRTDRWRVGTQLGMDIF